MKQACYFPPCESSPADPGESSDRDVPPSLEEAFRRGCESVARWPAHDPAELATFVMGRALVISNTALQLDLDDEIEAGVLARTEHLAHDTVAGLTVARTTPPAA
jgi:hypothetical protein